MSLVFNEDQSLLQSSARRFCQDHAPVRVLRQIRDERDPRGYPEALWKEMVDLGWAGMAIPEQWGGFGFGYSGLGIVLEETGRTLVPSPLVSTVLLGATAVSLGGSEAQKKDILPRIAGGELLLALALEETAFHDPHHIACRAEADGDTYRLSGRKQFVLDGHVADKLVVVCRTSGTADDVIGISVLLVDRDAPGVSVERTAMVDSRNAANVVFDGVEVSKEQILGSEGEGAALMEQVLDIGRIGLAAEMLGSAQQVFDLTVDYLKERRQFGVQIGAFQALQHRAAIMYSELELGRSLVRKALTELDGDQDDLAKLASAAKAKLSEVFFLISNEGVQMHGGIGMTDEFDIGFYLKRARVAGQCLGDAAFHRNRFATLNAY